MLITKYKLDYENSTAFFMCVRVTDQQPVAGAGRRKRQVATDPPSLRGRLDLIDNVALIEVRITDLNDNGPVFPTKTRSAGNFFQKHPV